MREICSTSEENGQPDCSPGSQLIEEESYNGQNNGKSKIQYFPKHSVQNDFHNIYIFSWMANILGVIFASAQDLFPVLFLDINSPLLAMLRNRGAVDQNT